MPRRLTADHPADLFDVAATRRLERAAAQALPPHTLMRRAGLAVARLAMALAPDARCIWIACGPGNNGGDGLEAALALHERGFAPVVTLCADPARLPPDAAQALARAQAAGIPIAATPPDRFDLGIDALLGIGAARAPAGDMAQWLSRLYGGSAPLLSVDLPSGLDADTGAAQFDFGAAPHARHARHCLSLLTLKPGLFTGHGRDAAGEVWFDDLGVAAVAEAPIARRSGAPAEQARAHAAHKGSFGDVAVIGGAPGMAGAALLAASAALHHGAGRVYVGLLDASAPLLDPSQPELMLRRADAFPLEAMTVVCGCGGGDAVRAHLPRVLASAPRLVLDADALNAVAQDTALQALLAQRHARGWATVLTPHPLEAARLAALDTVQVQARRLEVAHNLARRFGAVVVLKGSGTVVAAEGETPFINPTGNARLATAGTGDVLAGMIGAALASGQPAFEAARDAVWRHGAAADHWPQGSALTAGALARAN